MTFVTLEIEGNSTMIEDWMECSSNSKEADCCAVSTVNSEQSCQITLLDE